MKNAPPFGVVVDGVAPLLLCTFYAYNNNALLSILLELWQFATANVGECWGASGWKQLLTVCNHYDEYYVSLSLSLSVSKAATLLLESPLDTLLLESPLDAL